MKTHRKVGRRKRIMAKNLYLQIPQCNDSRDSWRREGWDKKWHYLVQVLPKHRNSFELVTVFTKCIHSTNITFRVRGKRRSEDEKLRSRRTWTKGCQCQSDSLWIYGLQHWTFRYRTFIDVWSIRLRHSKLMLDWVRCTWSWVPNKHQPCDARPGSYHERLFFLHQRSYLGRAMFCSFFLPPTSASVSAGILPNIYRDSIDSFSSGLPFSILIPGLGAHSRGSVILYHLAFDDDNDKDLASSRGSNHFSI
jgi:hypothetical protein